MDTSDYLERLLYRYSGTFDIYRPYRIDGKDYPAYGYFSSHVEKYVLVREANMWSADSYEHVLFMELERCTSQTLEEIRRLIVSHMEPELVLKGEKLPPKNHMYSYLTFALICRHTPDPETARLIRRFKFERGYRFNMRGYSQAHLICASMDEQSVMVNGAARSSRALYRSVFDEVEKGMPGFADHPQADV